jgi:hypothetical protein
MNANRTALITRIAGRIAATLFAAIAGLHVLWAVGISWPASSKAQLAEAFGFTADTLPPPPAILVVAGLLLAAALLVSARAGLFRVRIPDWMAGVGTWTVAVVLLGRALMGLGSIGMDEVAARLDVALYSPLCLVLGALTVVVARTGPARNTSSRRSSAAYV